MQNDNSLDEDREYMVWAIELAKDAWCAGEVPVGAIVVLNGEVVGQGFNQPISRNDPSAHAEIMALRDAGKRVSNYRMPDCTLYVTLEPCAMCAGAIMHARVRRVVFGAPDPKTGAAGSVVNLFGEALLNHHATIKGGVMADECGRMISDFFKERRARNLRES